VVESVDPEQPTKVKAEPGEYFITEMVTVEAAENEKTGLAEAHKRQHHEIRPPAIYADAGYVTESTLAQAQQNAMVLLGPTRTDPHKGPYNADGFKIDSRTSRPFVRRETQAINAAISKTAGFPGRNGDSQPGVRAKSAGSSQLRHAAIKIITGRTTATDQSLFTMGLFSRIP